MTLLTMSEIDAPYPYVVSDEAVAEVRRLLRAVPALEVTSVGVSAARGERSILELEGLGMEIWQGVDPRKYVGDLRDEWHNR